MAEGNTWKRKENLKNAEELIKEFEKGSREEKIQRIKLNLEVEEFRRMELPGKYMAKLLYR